MMTVFGCFWTSLPDNCAIKVFSRKSVKRQNSQTQRLRENSGNPTHGSGWIVQVRPTIEAARPSGSVISLPSRREGRETKNGNLGCAPCRLGLNDPPTAVGGIPGVFTRSI